MALSVDYLTRETGSNLVRNPSLSVATVLTVAVSLTLFGASLAIQKGVQGVARIFQGDVELIVWLNPDASEDQIENVSLFLDQSPTVDDAEYVDQEEIFAQFQDFYADNLTILETVEENELPTRFDVVPAQPDLSLIRSLGKDIQNQPGVKGVDFAEDFIKDVNDAVSSLSRIIAVWATISAFASALIMYNLSLIHI